MAGISMQNAYTWHATVWAEKYYILVCVHISVFTTGGGGGAAAGPSVWL